MSDQPPGFGRYFGPDYYGEQDENGVDLSLIRENLKLSPTQRARQGDRGARDLVRLMESGRRNRKEQARGDR